MLTCHEGDNLREHGVDFLGEFHVLCIVRCACVYSASRLLAQSMLSAKYGGNLIRLSDTIKCYSQLVTLASSLEWPIVWPHETSHITIGYVCITLELSVQPYIQNIKIKAFTN